MKLIIDTESAIKSANFVILEQSKFIYISCISCISCIIKKMNRIMNDIFCIIKKDNAVFIYNFENDVSMDKKIKLL